MKAILFDNDGVLADSEIAFFHATRDAFACFGINLRPEVWARWYLGEGRRSRDVGLALGFPPNVLDEAIANRNRMFDLRVANGIALRHGVRETVEALTGHVRMAIVTGCPRDCLEAMYGTSGFLGHFEVIVTSDDCENSKPHPEPYLKAMQELRIAAKDCLVVEDSPRGLAAALTAGLRCILVPTELTDISMCLGAWRTVSDLAQIVPVVNEWRKEDFCEPAGAGEALPRA